MILLETRGNEESPSRAPVEREERAGSYVDIKGGASSARTGSHARGPAMFRPTPSVRRARATKHFNILLLTRRRRELSGIPPLSVEKLKDCARS